MVCIAILGHQSTRVKGPHSILHKVLFLTCLLMVKAIPIQDQGKRMFFYFDEIRHRKVFEIQYLLVEMLRVKQSRIEML